MKSRIVILLACVFVFTQCKKGEDDPFFSFRTRKARLAGEWTLESYTQEETSANPIGGTTSTTVTGSGGTRVETRVYISADGDTSVYTNEKPFEQELKIKKDGSYSWRTNYENALGLFLEEGNWMFLRKSKKEDLKNKEAIGFFPSYGETDEDSLSISGISGSHTFILQQLKNKKMVWVVSYNYILINTSWRNKETYTWKLKSN